MEILPTSLTCEPFSGRVWLRHYGVWVEGAKVSGAWDPFSGNVCGRVPCLSLRYWGGVWSQETLAVHHLDRNCLGMVQDMSTGTQWEARILRSRLKSSVRASDLALAANRDAAAGLGAAGFAAAGLGAAGFAAAGLGAAGFAAAGLGTAGFAAAGLGTATRATPPCATAGAGAGWHTAADGHTAAGAAASGTARATHGSGGLRVEQVRGAGGERRCSVWGLRGQEPLYTCQVFILNT